MHVLPFLRSQQGTAAVELLAVLPLVGVVACLVAQAGYLGFANWRLHEAARDAARAAYVARSRSGDDAAARAARRSASDAIGSLARDLNVSRLRSGEVQLSVAAPLIAPFELIAGRRPILRARARFGQ
jgi:Flp pilus assembly protein TadG